eukprot:TRINITY_DN10175_c0_g1::TRINITY_DN10175_c0_g1_i1::g.7610::m.7610 TRINITY_DN10175_c0_g1::TRINITY_DN10175_c0_g1_i1::g.7610  ORF type:complete len:241 (-),score=11.45,Phage_integrase/PF00589.17/1.4e-12 TRINITY_DN10175_c0_g1_i1:171-893(-)
MIDSASLSPLRLLRDQVVTIIAYHTAPRGVELRNLRCGDLRFDPNDLDRVVITLTRVKNREAPVVTYHDIRALTVPFDPLPLLKTYCEFLSTESDDSPFFRNLIGSGENEKLSSVASKEGLARVVRSMAEALGREFPEAFTTHAFRRSSAIALANAGATLAQLKRFGGWRSEAAAQTYTWHLLAPRWQRLSLSSMSELLSLMTRFPSPSPCPLPFPLRIFLRCLLHLLLALPLLRLRSLR